MLFTSPLLLPVFLIFFYSQFGHCIRCYQCDSNEDDSCPARRYFNTRMNALIDCGSFQAKVRGTFCVKIYQESTGWHSWIKITRRCGSRTDFGLAWSCRYWFEAQGVYKEVCYCQDRDGCNTSPHALQHCRLRFLHLFILGLSVSLLTWWSVL